MSPATVTVTFLFTDIEGSTRLLQQVGDDYVGLLDEHRRLITAAVERAAGRVFGSEGDALFAAFERASAAIAAAAEAQRALAAHRWPKAAQIRVRMGIHTGEAVDTGDDYVGLALHQVARISSAGHGGMVLVSQATQQLAGELPDGFTLRDLGERRLKDLARPERLFQLVGDGLATDFPPLRTLDARPNNLPVQLTSFVGRDEVAAARAALAETRLLTLTGPGGTGKTRLSLQLAADASDDFPDGIWFVALDAVNEADLVAGIIAGTLDLPAGSAPPLERIVEHLRDRRVLLVLDNFEQVIDAGASVAHLLRELAGLKVVVTSRVVLRVYGEREFPVPPLGLPPVGAKPTAERAARAEAVRLFVERAMAVQPTFALTDDNAAAVVDICLRLDGLPLAIELAAARTRILGVDQLRSRLDQRLSLLTGGARDLPSRQQTLRGAIDWSYDLLDGPDAHLFRRFATFAGGAFLVQAEEVCGPAQEIGRDVLDGLSSLTEKSLARAEITADEDPRFAMLATIREYAHEKLAASGELASQSERHALAYAVVVDAAADQITGRDAPRWLARLDADHDNVRAAIDWSVQRARADVALRLLAGIWRYWQLRGHLAEARQRAEAILALPGVAEQPALLRARALGAAGSICYWQADNPAANRYYGEALEAARASGERAALARATYDYGFVSIGDPAATEDDRVRAGMPWWEQSLELYSGLGDEEGIANSKWGLAISLAAHGEFDRAVEYGLQSLETYRRRGDPFGIGWAAHMMSLYDFVRGDLDGAEELAREALDAFARSGDQGGILLLLADFMILAGRRAQDRRYWRLAGAVAALRQATGIGVVETALEFVDWRMPEPPGEEEARRAWDEGAQMSVDDIVAYALEPAS